MNKLWQTKIRMLIINYKIWGGGEFEKEMNKQVNDMHEENRQFLGILNNKMKGIESSIIEKENLMLGEQKQQFQKIVDKQDVGLNTVKEQQVRLSNQVETKFNKVMEEIKPIKSKLSKN